MDIRPPSALERTAKASVVWDRCPQPIPARFLRALAAQPFPSDFPFPTHLCTKKSPTAHLPTNFWGQRSLSRPPAPRRAA